MTSGETISEEMILTSVTKISGLLLSVFFLVSLVSADYYYSDQQVGSDWFVVPEYDSHEEIIAEFVAPFLFITILLQFSLKRALKFTFDTGDNPWEDGPNVDKEATIMAVTIALMVVVSPYWELIQQMAASIGVIAVGALILVFLFMIYVFVRP